MASVFKPTYTREIPSHAERLTIRGEPCVRWRGRGGRIVTARVSHSDATRCICEVGSWWISYTDENGEQALKKATASKDVSEDMMAALVRRVEQVRAGILPSGAEEASRSLHVAADEYRAHLAALARTPKHVALTHSRITSVIDGCRWRRFGDMDARELSRWLAERREVGLSVESSNHYLRAVRGFSRWLAHRVKVYDPLAGARPLNADADRRRVRRAVSRAEFERLIAATSKSVRTVRSLTGSDRAALYLVASFTGLRASELASLTRASVDVDAATVEVDAAYSKRRRKDLLPLARELVRQLRTWLDARPRGSLWPGTWHERAAEMLREDLHAAEILQVDTRGRVFDFHSLRGQFVTELARAGVSITVAQKLARHSTPALTARAYTRLELSDLRGAVDRIGAADEPEPLRVAK